MSTLIFIINYTYYFSKFYKNHKNFKKSKKVLDKKINDRLHFNNSKRSFICQDFSFCLYYLAYIISFYKSEAPDFHHPSHMYISE